MGAFFPIDNGIEIPCKDLEELTFQGVEDVHVMAAVGNTVYNDKASSVQRTAYSVTEKMIEDKELS